MNLELGKRIMALRKMQKITQAQLAEYLQVQPQTISRWETEGGMPDITFLPKIALFFSISMDELFGMTDMEQIDNLVYKYSILRDEKSWEEVMRSITLAINSIEEQLAENNEDNTELKQKREQLLAWKVHIYIQKSRKAQEEAETLLDELLKNIENSHHPLYLSLKLQKQQFQIQKGEGRATLQKAKQDWEQTGTIEELHCYMSALLELEKGKEILDLWQQEKVQELVGKITKKTIPLWQIMFDSAVIEQELSIFYKYLNQFQKEADEYAIFETEKTLANLYKILGMNKEKEESKEKLLQMLKQLIFHEVYRNYLVEKINEL